MSEDRSFEMSWDEDATTLAVCGDIESTNLDQLAWALRGAGETVTVVDLSRTTFLPSQAMGVLVTAAKRARHGGGSLRFVAAHGSLAARVLEVAGLLRHG